MAEPKSRISRSRRGMRRAHSAAIKPKNPGKCFNCGALTQPHCLCLSCGWYKNRQVIIARNQPR